MTARSEKAEKDAPEQQVNTPSTPLTLPCTAIQLRRWLADVDAIRPGTNGAVVSATASTLTVA